MNIKRIGSLILIFTIAALPGVSAFAEETAEPEQYIASAGFSTTQGENNWYYRSRNCNTNAESELTTTASSDGTTVWRQGGGNDRGYISKDTVLPGINAKTVFDTLRVFKAPKSGTLVIDANGDIGAKDSGIDNHFGVQICIRKNGQKIYPVDSEWEKLTERNQRINFESILAAVDKGDEISFEVHRTLTGLSSAEMRQNIIKWDPVITYLKMESVKVGGYSDGLKKEIDGFQVSAENEFYLAERGNGKVIFGDDTFENCGISATVSETNTEDEILLYANYSDKGGYSVRFSQEGTALLKNGEQVAFAENGLSDGANIMLETTRVGLVTFVSVKIDGSAVITYLDENGCAGGKLGIGAENAAVRFGDVSFYASAAQHDDLKLVTEAVTACEQLKEDISIENLSNASSAVTNAENTCAAYVLNAVIQEILSDSGYRYIAAEAETKSRTLRVKGLAYDLRNSEAVFTVSDSDGRSIIELHAAADSNGIIDGEVILPVSAGSGDLIVESKENNLRTTAAYRAASAECDILSFRLDGVSGTIGTNDIQVNLKSRTELKNMVALFTASRYAEIYVNGTIQESGVTANDFSNPVTYTVKAENGNEKNYSVRVSYQAESNSRGGAGGSSGGGAGVKRAVAVDKSIFTTDVEKDTEHRDSADSAESVESAYADVSIERWSYEYIKALTDKKIICGNNNGLFEPERSITRAEFIKMIVLALGLEETDNGARFDDVSDKDWYSSYVKTACAQGLAEGYDGHFGANDYITREDMCVIVHRSSGELPKTKESIDFDDAEEISDYARDSVAALCSAGIVNGEDGSFNPKAPAAREQAAKLVSSVCRQRKE